METNKTTGTIITFYSYKGGTGRSMALANIACLIARDSQKKVLVIDWDLEAPGLHRFFSEQVDSPENKNRPGLIEIFITLSKIFTSNKKLYSKISKENDWKMLDEHLKLSEFIVSNVQPGIDLIKAGSLDSEYSNKATSFDWNNFFTQYGLSIKLLTQIVSNKYDYCLIDSRTGITDTSGICTTILPEKLVLVFTPNKQSLYGVLDVAEKSVNYRLSSDDLRPLAIFPLPSRIDDAEDVLRKQWREEYQTEFEKLFKSSYELDNCDLTQYFDEVKLPYKSFYGYGEKIAVVNERDEALSLHRAYSSFLKLLINSEQIWPEAIPENDPLALLKNAQLLEMKGDFSGAIEAYRMSAYEFGKLNDQSSQSMALDSLGNILLKQGQANEAIFVYEQYIAVLERIGNTQNLPAILNNLGSAFHITDRFDDAINVYRKSLEISEQLNDEKGQSTALYNLANVFESLGEFENAEVALQRSYAILEKTNDKYSLPFVLNSLGNIMQRQGKLNQALDTFQKSYGILIRMGDERRQATVLNSIGDLLRRQGKYDEAIEYFNEATKIAEKIGDSRASVKISNSRNITIHQQGNVIVASAIQGSFNKIESATISSELKESLEQLTQAVSIMITELPKEQAEEVVDDLRKLTEEVLKETPNPKWYLVSIDGLTSAARNLGKIGTPVVKLAAQVAGLLRI